MRSRQAAAQTAVRGAGGLLGAAAAGLRVFPVRPAGQPHCGDPDDGVPDPAQRLCGADPGGGGAGRQPAV